jgi:hypothetical protein
MDCCSCTAYNTSRNSENEINYPPKVTIMKDARFLLACLAAAVAAIVLTSCGDTAATQPADDTYSLYVNGASSSAELLAVPQEFDDATVENEFRVKPNPTDNVGPNGGGRGIPNPFARLLQALNLTEDQRAQVATLLEEHRACATEALKVLREHNQTIIEAAKAARQEVLAKLEAGEITPEEARAAIKQINQRAREALKNSEVLQRVREMLKACDDAFIRSLSSILTEDQLAILKRWMDGKKDGKPPVGGRG